MSESHPEPSFSYEQVTKESLDLLGSCRIQPLAAFSTEEYLQRQLDVYYCDPSSVMRTQSHIGGASFVREYREEEIEYRYSVEQTADEILRESALKTFSLIGFGVVESTVTPDNYIIQADPEELREGYEVWVQQPLADRKQEIEKYLLSQNADLLAANLLDTEHEGTMLNWAASLHVPIPRVNGEPQFILEARDDDEAKTEILEGALGALYLLREHQVAQSVKDFEMAAPQHMQVDPPDTLPGYYLG